MPTTFATSDTSLYVPGRPQTNPINLLAGYNDLYLGSDGNIVVAGLSMANSDQLSAVLYSCQNLSRTVLGEEVLQTDRGIPNFETVWNGVPNLAQWEVALRSALLSVDGVSEILNVAVTKSNNELNYTVTILTTFGQGQINGTI